MPDQLSPQALGVYVDMLNEGERLFFGRLMAPESELGPIVKAFHGRLYFNLSQLRHVVRMVGRRPADMMRSFGHSEEIHPEDEIATRPPLREFLRALPDFLRIALGDMRAEHIFHAHEVHVRDILARLNAVDPATLSDQEICATFQWWLGTAPPTLKAVFVMANVQLREDFLRKAANAAGFPYDRLVYPQLAAGQRSVSTQQAVDLVALADVARHEPVVMRYLQANDGAFADFRGALAGTMFLDRFERFLERYGHRGHYESDWALPRLHENPAPALFAIRSHVQGKPQDAKAAARAAGSGGRGGMARLRGAAHDLAEMDAAAARARDRAPAEETVRVARTGALRPHARRVAHSRAGISSSPTASWHAAGSTSATTTSCCASRKSAAPPTIRGRAPELRAIAARRAAELARERDLQMPMLMRESELPALLRAGHGDSGGDGDQLTGLCVSPGSVEGEVVVMRDPSEFAAMKRGAILVAPATDPSWTPLFTLASGVIVEVGGVLSHASTIAREYGLPALANVRNATRILKSGDRVRLDASGGRVLRYR